MKVDDKFGELPMMVDPQRQQRRPQQLQPTKKMMKNFWNGPWEDGRHCQRRQVVEHNHQLMREPQMELHVCVESKEESVVAVENLRKRQPMKIAYYQCVVDAAAVVVVRDNHRIQLVLVWWVNEVDSTTTMMSVLESESCCYWYSTSAVMLACNIHFEPWLRYVFSEIDLVHI